MDDKEITTRLAEITGRIPTFAWRPDGTDFAPSEIGVHYGGVSDAPDRGVGIQVYNAIDAPDLFSRRVQFHVRGARGNPTDADRLAGILFTVFHERPRGDGFASILRTSFARLGPDGNRRQERTENYLVTLDNPEAWA